MVFKGYRVQWYLNGIVKWYVNDIKWYSQML